MKGKRKVLQVGKGETNTKVSSKKIDQVDIQDLPLFNFAELVTATSNFDLTNKLGQGGFGPVYRVIFLLIKTLLLHACLILDNY